MSNPAATDRPATFREALSSVEFRALFSASTLSWLGDNMARAAIAALVLHNTQSIAFSAATFAISYLPWLGIGSVLTAYVDRYPYRRVMIACDLGRMITMALVAVPDLPAYGMVGLLFMTALLNPPFDASRSALLPELLSGDRYVLGLSLMRTTGQATIIVGYVLGSALAAQGARMAVLGNAATFGVSALMIWLGVRRRPATRHPDQDNNVLRQTKDGFVMVFQSPLLRAIAIVMFLSVAISVLPEGLAAAWAIHLTADPDRQGWYQGLIMMASPLGFVLGGLTISRFLAPSNRLRLIRPFTILTPCVLTPALLDPPLLAVVAMNAAAGFCIAGLLPSTNSLFIRALPVAYRARAFGVMQSGMLLSQGAAVLIGGAFSNRSNLPTVVGLWAAAGVVIMIVVAQTWPSEETIAASFDAAAAIDARTAAGAADAPSPDAPSADAAPASAPSPDAAPASAPPARARTRPDH